MIKELILLYYLKKNLLLKFEKLIYYPEKRGAYTLIKFYLTESQAFIILF